MPSGNVGRLGSHASRRWRSLRVILSTTPTLLFRFRKWQTGGRRERKGGMLIQGSLYPVSHGISLMNGEGLHVGYDCGTGHR